MAVAVDNRTLAAVVAEVSRLGGWWRNAGTFSAGTTTTGTDTVNERTPVVEANSVSGNFLYSTAGTGAGDEHEISSYGTIGVYTWAVAGTAPTTTTTYIRMAIRPQLILDAIAEVTRQAAWKQAIPYLSEALVTNNLLMHFGAMEEWTNGAASAPDGFTLGGAGAAVARVTSPIHQGNYAAELTAGGGAVGTLTRTIPFELYEAVNNTSLRLYGFVRAANAADVTVRVTVTNGTSATGTSTNTDRANTYTGRYESLDDISSATISATEPVTALDVQVRAVAAAVVYVDDLALCGPYLYNYDLPAVLVALEPTIWMETAFGNRQFTIPLYHGADWEIVKQDSSGSAYRQIHFFRPQPSARHLRIKGYRAPDVQTTATSNVDPNPVWLAYAAAVRLVGQVGAGSDRVNVDALRAELRRLEGGIEGNPHKNVIIIPIESR